MNGHFFRRQNMDIYDSSYFRINKKLQMCVGLWPYESKGKKIILRLFFGGGIIIMAAPHIIGLRMYFRVDIDRALEHIAVIMYCSMSFMKMVTSTLTEYKLKILYDDIGSNWQTISDKSERAILIKHSRKGRFLTLYYLTYMIVATILFTALPLIPIILNKLKPLNESRPYIFILDGEFIVDRNLNYSRIYVFDFTTVILTVTIMISVDTTYAACVQHCIGLFAILKYRLRKPHKLVYNGYAGSNQEDTTYEWMISTIQLHKKVLSFKDTMETSYSSSFLVLMSISLVYLSIVSVLVSWLLAKANEFLDLIRYIGIMCGVIVHLLYLSWPGQQLIDYSSGLFRDTYFNEWYEGSMRSKKLLRIMTLRCAQPCVITAGGLYVMNLQNFLSILKTSISYITVFASFR